MKIEIIEVPITRIEELEQVSIAFLVDRIYDVISVNDGSGGFVLSQKIIDVPYIKDYDRTVNERPSRWAASFDIRNWGFIRAHSESKLVGGAVIAFDTPDVRMLEGHRDLAVLWDIRVAPEVRKLGIGSKLLQAAETWAISRGCKRLKVETQNINWAACRFYEEHGFELKIVNPLAYPELPGEIQLLWYKELS
jgi:ribosomal protein S18 acetylase RimI-like enzyme